MPAAVPLAACPACSAAPLAHSVATGARAADPGTEAVVLALPGIHCAACIGGVERALLALPEVAAARVNLSRKRVRIDTDLEPETLIDALAAAGFAAQPLDPGMVAAVETDAAGRALLLRLAVAGFAMMNVMLFSVAVWSGAGAATARMFHWISAGIAVPTLIFSAQVFFRSAIVALRGGRLNMDVPISLAIILAAGLSVYETAAGHGAVYFDAALSLTFFLLVGRYLDHRTRMAARSAAEELSALESPRALRFEAGTPRPVAVAALAVGDVILVRPGMRVPVDGVVVHGRSDLDRSLLSGESQPVAIAPGGAVEAGVVNLTGPLDLRVTAIGADTSLRRMAALIETAEAARNTYTALADRAARIYAPMVHLLALVTFIGWVLVAGDWARALNVAISVLIITCPCALGLAVPAVMTAATGRLFRRGLLVKNGTALERLAEVRAVVFDKTGTLTTGAVRLDAAQLDPDAQSVLAALAQASDHPVSRVLASALGPDITTAPLTDIVETPGQGIAARWRGQEVRLGSGTWLGAPRGPAFAIGTAPPKVFDFSETLRPGAADTVAALQAAGLSPHIFSGDAAGPVARIASDLGVTEAMAQMSPGEKQRDIARLSDAEGPVLMVGDGLNDTAALAAAHASISPASALDASRAASDIVILGPRLDGIPEAIATARAARRRVLENFAIAAGYNMIAIPIAVMGYASPLAAAIAMSVSSITVLLNALRLR